MSQHQTEGYLTFPRSGKGDPVLILHAWWGLNDTIKGYCKRLAEAGFVAFAPDLYHGKVAATIPEAQALGEALDGNFVQAKAEIADAAAFLNECAGQSGRGLAVIAFSLGAYYAVDLSVSAPESVDSVVLFYGVGDGDVGQARAAYLGHFAEHDEFESPEDVDAFEEAVKRSGRPITVHRYGGMKHWFFEPDRPEYDAEAASLAWERTLEFLKRPD